MNAKLGRIDGRSGWSPMLERFVPTCALMAVLLAMGCSSEEKTNVNADENDGLVVDPTTLPCKGAAWSDDVCIPGGEFKMGHKEIPYTPPPCPSGEVCGPGDPPPTDFTPPHIVKLSPYFIDRYPATNAEYKACYDAGMCPGDCIMLQSCGGGFYHENRINDPLLAGYPALTITMDGVEAYCLWKGKRLPTEAEWERAARGPKSFNYPWGNEAPDCSRYPCNPSDMPASWSYYYFAPVGANLGDVSPEGVHDMVTSAIQLVYDTYDYYYYQHTPYENPQKPPPGTFRVARGNVTLGGNTHGSLVYNGMTWPLPAWVRSSSGVGGVRCARSDEGATATGEQFYRLRQRMLRGDRLTSNGGAQ